MSKYTKPSSFQNNEPKGLFKKQLLNKPEPEPVYQRYPSRYQERFKKLSDNESYIDFELGQEVSFFDYFQIIPNKSIVKYDNCKHFIGLIKIREDFINKIKIENERFCSIGKTIKIFFILDNKNYYCEVEPKNKTMITPYGWKVPIRIERKRYENIYKHYYGPKNIEKDKNALFYLFSS